MGNFDKEIAEAVDKLRLIKTRWSTGRGKNKKVSYIHDPKVEPIPYLAFQWDTGYVVIAQDRFNQLSQTDKNKLLEPMRKEEKVRASSKNSRAGNRKKSPAI